MSATIGRDRLLLHSGLLLEPGQRAAYERLMRDVIGLTPGQLGPIDGCWHPFCLFHTDGSCIAAADAAVLPLIADGERCHATAVRSVAVDPAWRGKGLFRTLMIEVLSWCDSRTTGPALLYTEEPALYRRFGFHPCPQHAFVGEAPAARRGAKARRLDLALAPDAALARDVSERRAPISRQCALQIDPPQLMANLAKDDELVVVYDPPNRAVIAYEIEDDFLTIVDVIAPSIPHLPAITGALDVSRRRIRTLFPPDALGWSGSPTSEETGLMVRGAIPDAMKRPFMFPPTAEF